MKFRHVEIFRALMLTHSVTRAAEQLQTSQPTASRYLAELEEEIGFPLFERAHGRIVPTHEAQALYEEVARSFVGLGEIEKAAADIAAFRADRLRIASISSLALGLLVPMVPGFCAEHEGVEIALNMFSFEEVVANVAAGRCEVGFVAYPVDRPGVVEHNLIRAHAVCVMPSDHPLARLDVVTPHDIDDTPFISLAHDIPSGKRIDAIFARAGVTRRMGVETQAAAVVCELVEAGAGIAIIDPFTAHARRSRATAIRPFRPAAPFGFRYILRSDRPPSRLTQRFLQATRDWLAQLPSATFLGDDPSEPPIGYADIEPE